jgi:LysM repeat protein
MKYIRTTTVLLAIAAILLSVAPVGAAGNAASAGGSYSYTVLLGDTLYKISQKFGVSPDVILDVNNLRRRPDLLYAGEKITLPITMGFKPSYVNAFFYVVQTGDTVQLLNNRFFVDRFALRQVNGLPADSNLLTPGATILVPAGPHHYAVLPGDTIQGIAAMFGQKGNDLLKANPQLGSALFLAPGTFVYIPIAFNAPYTPIGAAPAGSPSEGFGGGGQGGGGFTSTGNPATGLLPTDIVDSAAFNSAVTSAFMTISMPQNVVNLNQQLQIRWEQLRRVRRDSSRENGAIATFAVQFRGGTGTVTVKHWETLSGGLAQVGLPITGIYVNAGDAELWNDIEVDVPATCSAGLQDQLIITSGITLEAHLSQWIACP